MLRLVLLPALQGAAAGQQQAVLQTVAAVQSSLTQLEKLVRLGRSSVHDCSRSNALLSFI